MWAERRQNSMELLYANHINSSMYLFNAQKYSPQTTKGLAAIFSSLN